MRNNLFKIFCFCMVCLSLSVNIYGKDYSPLSPPNWAYSIPSDLVGDSVNPIHLELSNIIEDKDFKTTPSWKVTVTPYVKTRDLQSKQYFFEKNPSGQPDMYTLYNEDQTKNQGLKKLRFYIFISLLDIDDNLKNKIKSLKEIKVDKMLSIKGYFKDLQYKVVVNLNNEYRELPLRKKWIKAGEIFENPVCDYVLHMSGLIESSPPIQKNNKDNKYYKIKIKSEKYDVFYLDKVEIDNSGAKPEPLQKNKVTLRNKEIKISEEIVNLPAWLKIYLTIPGLVDPLPWYFRLTKSEPHILNLDKPSPKPFFLSEEPTPPKIIFKLSDIPYDSRKLIKSEKDIILSNERVNQKKESLSVIYLTNTFEIERKTGHLLSLNDEVSFTLKLLNLYPVKVNIKVGEMLPRPNYLLKQQAFITALDSNKKPVSGIKFQIQFKGDKKSKPSLPTTNDLWFKGNTKYAPMEKQPIKMALDEAIKYETITLAKKTKKPLKPKPKPKKTKSLKKLSSLNLRVDVTYREKGQEKNLKNANCWVIYQNVNKQQRKKKLIYKKISKTYTLNIKYLTGTNPTLLVKAGKQFEEYKENISSDYIQVRMNYAKPFLYVFINPNDHLNRGPIQKNSNNFLTFREKFLYLVSSLDSEKKWRDRFGKIFIYSVNLDDKEPEVLKEPGPVKINWQDSNFKNNILKRITLRNSFVPYKDVVDKTANSLKEYSFSKDKSVHGVMIYILGAPPEKIDEPDKELGPLEDLLVKNKIVGVIAQFADISTKDRVNITSNKTKFKKLRLLEMNINSEFNDFFTSAMEHIKDNLSELLNNNLTIPKR
ncbi:exported hypothetical protein [Candidatus Magnetomoraceae bacterium gMMP-15]